MAVDVGGTFTDVCVLDQGSGELQVAKVASTKDPIDGVMAGVEEAGIDLSATALFCHGTTVATNALITRRLPKAAMVCTKGFRDVVEIGRGTRDDLWDAYKDNAEPYIRRRDRLEVTERVDHTGQVLTALDEDEARNVARILAKRNIETVAVCFVNAYANGDNEQRMAEILQEALPDATISTSSGVLPELFEHERFSTTVANAVLSPLVSSYVNRLDERLKQDGYDGDLLILHSGGGVMTPEAVQKLAVRLAASGIAAGAVAARYTAELCGFKNVIGVDMGGTSTDISLVYDNQLRTTNEWFVEYGHPICFPSIEVLTIGAGGGSLARIDAAGSLRNGPQSAGSDPGPAAYGKGGEEPTNTDANLVLGRLGTRLVGGGMELDRDAATAAVDKIGEPLNLDTHAAAEAIIAVANANMADAVRIISLQRGYDPREFALVVFGGAGPLHGAALAKELGVPTVLVPPRPGTWSALGCLMVDIRHDLSEMFLRPASDADASELQDAFERLEEQGRQLLAHEGVAEDDVQLDRSIAMRYLGQWRSLEVAYEDDLNASVERFHQEHEREFSYRRDDAPVELYRLQVVATGKTAEIELPKHERTGEMPEPIETRTVYFDGEPTDTPVYERSDLPAGARFEGPAVIDQLDTTTLVPPGVNAEVDEWLNIRMEVK
ncbi:hydantoinase/oxoprolinase family protein [Solirubrobacter sp. CPCC 204708]|uniref:Hydantoinase/oxoprolinase family protein n=1 Tax=Solirubrobacter deserti TaxID=2282478 RepID=A0ABT4RQE9_9ACTN|nr:hydantoinase/oxoprolinase family protein [Solirubrobacter deserti]MDA0140798.1 hydantoinase/oxoprolinase family protein [Solirubrobacter deserti]